MSSSYGTPQLNVVNAVRIDIHDTDYSIQPLDYLISIVAPLTAQRKMTLPDATVDIPIGKMYIIKDESYSADANNILVVGFGTPGSEQPIDGLTPGAVINSKGGSLTLVSNGVSWYIV